MVSVVRLAVFSAVLTLSLSIAGPQERVFEPIALENLDFNFPNPPREGSADFFPIAKNGEAMCIIVIPAHPERSFRAAASEFVRYLTLATGAKFQLVEEGQFVEKGLAEVHLGSTKVGMMVDLELPALEYGGGKFPNVNGFLVKTLNSKTLVIRGENDLATQHGLVGFLKRYVGIRQYWYSGTPEISSHIPNRDILSLPELEWRDWPYFASFQMSMRPFGSRPYLNFHRESKRLPCNENYDKWLRPSQWVESNPEYFALINGKRLQPKDSQGSKGWQPCVSNPDVRKVMGEAVIKYFRENPNELGVNVAINDGGGDCTCENCRALDAPETDYSRGEGMGDRYVWFTNQICEIVGKEFPDKFIVYLAYASASSAPKTVTPHPRLLPVTTTSHHFGRWDEWMNSGASHLGIYAHHLGTFAILPKMDAYQQAKRIRYSVSSGKARTYYMECHTQWPYSDVIPYLTAELTWDPRRDVDDILDEYFTKFYREAAEPMRDYYSVLGEGYERWLSVYGRTHWYGRDISSYAYNKSIDQFKVLSPEEAGRAMVRLDRAARATDDPIVAERIKIIRGAFGLQQIGIEWGWAAFRLRDEPPKSELEAQRRIADARLVFAKSREAKEYVETVLEQPPLKQWNLFTNSTKPLALYQELKSGKPGREVRSIVTLGLHATEKYVRDEFGGEMAAKWWRDKATKESEPELNQAFQNAAKRALEPEPENLLDDSGFENFTTADSFEAGGEILLDEALTRKAGVHLTFPDRTPHRIAISTEEVRSGKRSLMIEHAARARVTRHIAVEQGGRYRAGFWLRQDKGTVGAYEMTVDARLKDGSYETLSKLTIPIEAGLWRQYITEVRAPENAQNLFIRLHVSNQAAGVRCWVDDFFISK